MSKLRCTSNKSEHKQLANYTLPLFEVVYVFTDEMLLYKEQGKRVTKIES